MSLKKATDNSLLIKVIPIEQPLKSSKSYLQLNQLRSYYKTDFDEIINITNLGDFQMSFARIIKTGVDAWIDPGQTQHRTWNNADIREAIWSAQAIPFSTGNSTKGFNEDVALEVTRVWRRLIVTEIKPFPQNPQIPTGVASEDEIHYEVKNVGTQRARYTVYLSSIYG